MPGPSGVWVARHTSRGARRTHGIVRSTRERPERGAELDRAGEGHPTPAGPGHPTRTDAVNDAVNDAPGRTVGWSPDTSAFVGAVIGSRQQKPCAAGANTWR